MERHSIDNINVAFNAQKGGRYRLICNRTLNGQKCICFARIVDIDDVQYWDIHYKINGSEAEQFNGLVNAMYDIAIAKCVELRKKSLAVIYPWRY